jgi:hypothetical protein
VDDNGSRIQVSANVIPYNDADGHAVDQQRKFKVYNAIGNVISTTRFNVNVQPTMGGLGAFSVNNPGSFNRERTLGDDVSMTGFGLLNIKEIQIVDENGTVFVGAPKIVLPHPGVTVTDTTINIDTQTAQFNNASVADSAKENRYRKFKLTSDREAIFTSIASRFEIGMPPTHTTLAGISNSNLDWRRDGDHNMTINGTGFPLLTKVEIVDVNGNPIVYVYDTLDEVYVSDINATAFNLKVDIPLMSSFGHLIDSSTYLADGRGVRRIKVTTPFGTVTSPAGTGFTISATPDFLPISGGANPTGTASATFAGSVDFNGSDYNASYGGGLGLLVINGSNFRGLKRIYLGNSTLGGAGADGPQTSSSIQVDPNAMPAGIVINAAGTQISMTKLAIDTINPAWINTANSGSGLARRVMLMSAADQNSTTPLITPYN